MSGNSILMWLAVTLIATGKIASFVVAVRRALRPRNHEPRTDQGDGGGGYRPDDNPKLWPIRPRSGSKVGS